MATSGNCLIVTQSNRRFWKSSEVRLLAKNVTVGFLRVFDFSDDRKIRVVCQEPENHISSFLRRSGFASQSTNFRKPNSLKTFASKMSSRDIWPMRISGCHR